LPKSANDPKRTSCTVEHGLQLKIDLERTDIRRFVGYVPPIRDVTF
jgi:hypothetical protein